MDPSELLLHEIAREVRICEDCGLCKSRLNAVPGEGPHNAKIMFIGEGPGRNEDKSGRPFVGSAGKNLDLLLASAGLTRNEVFITNVVKCRPPHNRPPTKTEADACYQYLRRQMDVVNPSLVVLLGATALNQFFPKGTLSSLHGKVVKREGRRYLPTYHPAATIYNRSLQRTIARDFAQVGRFLRSRQ